MRLSIFLFIARMKLILIRLAFIKVTQVCFVLLISLLLVQASEDEKGFVLSRFLDSLPLLVFGLMGGLIVDRLGAARVNRLALAAYVFPPLALLAVQFKFAPQGLLIAASVAIASISNLLMVCSDRLVLDLIAKRELAKYNATSILIEQVCTLALPPLFGVLAWWSMDAAVMLAGLIAFVGSLALSYLSPAQLSGFDAPALSWIAHMKKGFLKLSESRFQLQLSLVVMFINAIEALPITYAFVYAHDSLHMNAAEIGFLSTMSGLGGLVGAMVARKINGERAVLLNLLAGSIFLNASVHGAVFLFDQKYALYLCVAVGAFSFVFTAVSYRSLRQESIDKSHFGVISSALAFIVKLGIPFGILFGGALMLNYGSHQVYIFTSIAEAFLGLAVLVWVKRQFQTQLAGAVT